MSRRRKLCAALLSLSVLAPLVFQTRSASAQNEAAPAPLVAPYFTEPTLSPDRREIAFVSGGDIWSVGVEGGEARLLVAHPSDERRPQYSPDGRSLAFTSTRTGNGDLYVLTLDTGELRRVTFDDGGDNLDAWSADGRWLYFSSISRDISGMNDIFRVSPAGGTPMQVSADRYVNEFFSQPSPDGTALAISARGISSGQWWRKGHSHLDESEIWLARGLDAGNTPTYEQVAERGAKNLWPMWGADGRRLFYVSDRDGAQNVWSQTPGQAARRVTNFRSGRVLWPNISRDGRLMVFEHDFRIWKLDTDRGSASEVSITRRGAPSSPAVEHVRLSDQLTEFALSPDGKKVAFVVRGEVFAASAADGGDAARVTSTPQAESQVAWSPDSRRLTYISDRDGTAHLYSYDFQTSAETQLTTGPLADDTPRYSPDGKRLAYQRAGRELRVITLDGRQDRLVATGIFDRPPINPDRPYAWSPDSKWIAYVPVAEKLFRNAYVVSADGGEPRPVSFLANAGGGGTVSWSADGTYLLFNTGQRTESGQLARVDLIPRTPRFREDQFRELFREETPRNLTPRSPEQIAPTPTPPAETPSPTPTPSPAPAPAASPTPSPTPDAQARPADRPGSKPVQIVFDGIRRRLSLLPVGLDVAYQSVSPDGKWVVFIAAAANQLNLYVYSLDELAREPAVARQLTSTAGFKSFAQFTPDSKEVFYLEAPGRIQIVNLEGRVRPLAVTMLRLCRSPRPDPDGFRADVERAAGRFGADAGKLAAVVRQVEGVIRLREAGRVTAEAGFFLAARDGDPPGEGS
jgi:Tol biopolymer transport system component